MMLVPVMSEGIRSGVNWIRENDRSSASASARTMRRLAQARHALEQHVAAGQQRGHEPVHDGLLPDDAPADLGEQARRVLHEAFDRLG